MRHPLDAYGKEFVLLCKMIGKQQEIPSCRSANKVYHIFLAFFSWYSKNPQAENGVESEN